MGKYFFTKKILKLSKKALKSIFRFYIHYLSSTSQTDAENVNKYQSKLIISHFTVFLKVKAVHKIRVSFKLIINYTNTKTIINIVKYSIFKARFNLYSLNNNI